MRPVASAVSVEDPCRRALRPPRGFWTHLFRVPADAMTDGDLLRLQVVAVARQLVGLVRRPVGPIATPVLVQNIGWGIIFSALAYVHRPSRLKTVGAVRHIREASAGME